MYIILGKNARPVNSLEGVIDGSKVSVSVIPNFLADD